MTKFDRNLLEAERTLTESLKGKSRRRRENLARLAAPSASPRPRRNDMLPPLMLVGIALDELRPPARKVRAVDPAHVRDVAGSISALGFCIPVLVGKDNVVVDGVVRVEAARPLRLLTH